MDLQSQSAAEPQSLWQTATAQQQQAGPLDRITETCSNSDAQPPPRRQPL